MLKKSIFFFVIILVIYSCKKDNKGPLYDLTGTWVLSSMSTNGHVVSAADFPCIANDSLVFGSNNSATVRWYDATTCWIDAAHTAYFSGEDGLVIDYTRNGNNLYLPPVSSTPPGYGTISSVNGNLQLILRDTIRTNTPYVKDTIYLSSTYIKH